MKRSVPAAVSVTTPPVTTTPAPPAAIGVPLICVTVSVSPSASVSLLRTSKVTGVSSPVTKLSFAATGASFTDAKLPLTVAVEVAPDASATV